MEAKVIYRDGSIGIVGVLEIDDLAEEGKIAAYKIYHKWIEIRRKHVYDSNYKGPERRKSNFIINNNLASF